MTLPGPAGEGWIGSWSPGIGDPTFAGWLTVLLYGVAAWQSYRVAACDPDLLMPSERTLWRIVTVGLVALGINKQLDLQTALTEIGRLIAHKQGWYETRYAVQRQFTFFVAEAAFISILVMGYFARHAPLATKLTLGGAIVLLAFVVIRAASFHHVDLFLADEWMGLRMNWLLEMGGILIIVAGAVWRRHTIRPADWDDYVA